LYKDMSVLVYAYILMDCFKEHGFEKEGFENNGFKNQGFKMGELRWRFF